MESSQRGNGSRCGADDCGEINTILRQDAITKMPRMQRPRRFGQHGGTCLPVRCILGNGAAGYWVPARHRGSPRQGRSWAKSVLRIVVGIGERGIATPSVTVDRTPLPDRRIRVVDLPAVIEGIGVVIAARTIVAIVSFCCLVVGKSVRPTHDDSLLQIEALKNVLAPRHHSEWSRQTLNSSRRLSW